MDASGRLVAYSALEGNIVDGYFPRVQSLMGLPPSDGWLHGVAAGATRLLTEAEVSDPVLSPDGSVACWRGPTSEFSDYVNCTHWVQPVQVDPTAHLFQAGVDVWSVSPAGRVVAVSYYCCDFHSTRGFALYNELGERLGEPIVGNYPHLDRSGRYVLYTDGEQGAGLLRLLDRATGEVSPVPAAGAVRGFLGKLGGGTRYAAFSTEAALAAADTNDRPDVYRHDRVSGETVLVSAAPGGEAASGITQSMSADGRYVAYTSGQDAFVWDAQTADEVRAVVDGLGRLVTRSRPDTDGELLGLFHPTLAEHLAGHPERVLDVTNGRIALLEEVERIAPVTGVYVDNPLYRWASGAEAEHYWHLGMPMRAHTSLRRRPLPTPRDNLGRWTNWLPRFRRALGPDHLYTLATRGNVAFWTGECGDAAAALRLLGELLPDQTRVLTSAPTTPTPSKPATTSPSRSGSAC